tara:strand:- start:27200 stop:29956 length:2757 start_codon:yes stop_codon:yes gene_type:complete
MLIGVFTYAQTTVTGSITDSNGQPLSGATVIVVDSSNGVVADFDGNYSITEDSEAFSIEASSVGFQAMQAEVSGSSTINFVLNENTNLDEVVVSAFRKPQRVFESPVTIERFDTNDIKNTASADFYDGLENLKGVDINVNSLTFKAINARGFGTFTNTRFVQLVDGMDNAAPVLNFPLGNLLGMTETDVLNIELIPGTNSALYGANAMNGILLMRSKSPFDYQGISGQYKRGVTSQDAAGDNEFQDLNLRWGHKFSDKLAAKVNFAYMEGTDWYATNYDDIQGRDITRSHYGYNGINIYGDEIATNLKDAAQAAFAAGVLPADVSHLTPSVTVSRTGYREIDLTDYVAMSKKADWGLFYRPFGDDLEISYVGKWGTGQTVYQGTNRYSIKNFLLNQNKLEIKNDNFLFKAYVTEDNAGDSYDMAFAAWNINRYWKDDSTWFGTYAGNYGIATLNGASDDAAHAFARAAADEGRLLPGSSEFEEAKALIAANPDPATGSRLQDNSKFYHSDFNYNFDHLWDWAEVQVGGSYRQYNLNSNGSIFTDAESPISYEEYGIYSQFVKDLLDDRLKVTASARFDKSEFFDGRVTPRVSVSYTAGENRNHNIRASYQTGFRNPSTQGLFIGFDLGIARLVGGAPGNAERFTADYGISVNGQNLGIPETVTISGQNAYDNSYSVSSFTAFGNSVAAGAPDPTLLQSSGAETVVPEEMQQVEIGYRGKISNNLTIDANVFANSFENFINTLTVITPLYGQVADGSAVAALANNDWSGWSVYTNADAEVSSWGATIGFDAKLMGFDISGNYSTSKLDFDRDQYPDFDTNWNTPEHRVKVQFGNRNIFKNVGFNVAYRYSSDYYWEATFAEGPVPEYQVVDAQINLTLPKLKSVVKLGATNLGGDDYFTALGTGFIGQQYYISWTANNF